MNKTERSGVVWFDRITLGDFIIFSKCKHAKIKLYTNILCYPREREYSIPRNQQIWSWS